jgi:Tol biopolymer transport system component
VIAALALAVILPPVVQAATSVKHDVLLNGRIAYVANEYPQTIWTVDEDGANATPVVANAYEAAWSPDGTKLAFVRFVVRLPQRGIDRIFVTDADGSNPRRVVDGTSPSWSPDGTKLAYTCDPPSPPPRMYGNGPAVCVANTDGTGVRTLTAAQDAAEHPVWSPEGNRIAYVCSESFRDDLCVMRPDGGGRVRLTRTSAKVSDTPLDWSRSGDRILLEQSIDIGRGHCRGCDIPRYVSRLAVVNPDGTGFRYLPLPHGACCGHWSPDGTKLVFQLGTGIQVGDRDGANAHEIGEGAVASWGVGPRRRPGN